MSTNPEKYPDLFSEAVHKGDSPSSIELVYALKNDFGLVLSSVCSFRRIGAMSCDLPIRRHHMSMSRHGLTCNFATIYILNDNEKIPSSNVLELSINSPLALAMTVYV